MKSNCVLTRKNINVSNILYDDIIMSQNKQFAIAKIWMSQLNMQMHSLFYQTDALNIHELTDNNDLLVSLQDTKELNLFNEIDRLSIQHIKSSNIIKELNLNAKIVKYKSVVNEIENENQSKINILKLKIMNNNKTITKFYKQGDRQNKKFDDISKSLITGQNIKAIIEIDGLIIDIKNNTLFTNVILHQLRIEKITPIKLTLGEYSFVDSDENNSENESENNLENDSDENNSKNENNLKNEHNDNNLDNDSDDNDSDDNNSENESDNNLDNDSDENNSDNNLDEENLLNQINSDNSSLNSYSESNISSENNDEEEIYIYETNSNNNSNNNSDSESESEQMNVNFITAMNKAQNNKAQNNKAQTNKAQNKKATPIKNTKKTRNK